MLGFILKRFLVLIPTFVGITIVAFGLIRLVPGDPVLLMIGERGASEESILQMKAQLGLDKPVLTQYWIFVSQAAQGNLGDSVVSGRPVWEEFKDRYPATVELGLVALIFSVVLGVPLGILAAVKRNGPLDYLVMGSALVGYSMPIFWWGLMLIIVFSVNLGLTPVSGRLSADFDIPLKTGFYLIDAWFSPDGWQAFKNAAAHLVLPAVVLGTIPLAMIARMTRSSMLEVIGEDYIRTARAKGLTEKRVIFIHALRNGLIPVVTVVGLMLGTLITGAILTETIFSWPGIGKWIVNSVTARDYPVIQSGILLIASIIIFINLLVDVVYGWVNPRMRDLK
jgi:dipeptide transport system permease protein